MSRSKLFANFFGQFWVAGVGFAFVPIYLHFIGVEAYGIVGFMVTLQAWMSILDFGMTPAIGREMGGVMAGQRTHAEGRSVVFTFETVAGAFAGFAVLVFVFLSGWLTQHWLKLGGLDSSDVQLGLALMAPIVGFRFLIALYRGAILGLQDAVHFNLACAGFATLRGGITLLAIATIAPSIWIFAAAQLSSTLFEALYFSLRVRKLLPTDQRVGRFDRTVLVRLWRFAAGVSTAAIFAVALTQIDKLVLSALLPLTEFASYFLAATLAGAILTVVGPISSTAFPKLSELVASRATTISSVYHASCQLVAVMVFPMVVVAWAFPEEILLWWTRDGDVAREAAPIFQVLAIGTALNALMQIPYMLQLSHGWAGLGAKANLVACVVLLPAIYIVVPRMGALGGAYVWLALNLAYVTVVVPVMHQKLLRGEALRWYLGDNVLPAIASALAAAIVKPLLPIRVDGTASSMLLILCVGIVTVLSASMVAKTPRSWLLSLVGRRHGNA